MYFFVLHAYRYSYDIAFVGRDVIGNVATLSIDEAACSSFSVDGGGGAEVSVETLNDGDAVGTSTTVQHVKVCIMYMHACLFSSGETAQLIARQLQI